MKHFIGTLLGMVLAANVAFAGIMPSLEVSGAATHGDIISPSTTGFKVLVLDPIVTLSDTPRIGIMVTE